MNEILEARSRRRRVRRLCEHENYNEFVVNGFSVTSRLRRCRTVLAAARHARRRRARGEGSNERDGGSRPRRFHIKRYRERNVEIYGKKFRWTREFSASNLPGS